ncbi:MAG TPA: hypothetical protein VM012_04095 [Flavitalea sp.]|nr:hypothetical protein [Flavitalea sp.]
MEQKSQINELAEAALNSLDGLRKASPGPYFFTRLETRMNRQKRSAWDFLVTTLSRPAISLTLVILIISVNTIAVLRDNDAVANNEQSEPLVSDEYNLNSTSYLDYVTQEP